MAKKTTKTYYVQGMHCQACELLLEREINSMSGVSHADASLSNQCVTVSASAHTHDDFVQRVNARVVDNGYIFSTKPIGAVAWNQETIVKMLSVFGIAYIAYLMIEGSGLGQYAIISQQSSLWGFFAFGLLAGISSCAALVGGLLLSLSRDWTSRYGGQSRYQATLPFGLFNAGRLLSYAVFGAVLGAIGTIFQLSLNTTSLLIAGVSLLMVVIGMQMLGVPWVRHFRLQLPASWTRRMSDSSSFRGKYMPFLAGAGTFFLPCGFTFLTQSVALALGNPIQSALVMLMFALGTLPSLTVISATSITFQSKPQTAATYNLVVGSLIILFGLYNLNAQMGLLGLPNTASLTTSGADTSAQPTSDAVQITTDNGQQVQQVAMQAKGFEYMPKAITLKADIPTRLTVTPEGVVGCAQAMYMPGLHDEVILLNDGPKTITFTPKKGTYTISCTMGMVPPVTVTVL